MSITMVSAADISDASFATPLLVVDAAAVRSNLQRMVEYCRQHDLALRPHAKTHKSRKLARLQLEAGAAGLTVAKVGEASVMAQTGADLLLAYPAVDDARTRRVAEIARHNTIRVAIDSRLAADRLASAARRLGTQIGILVDLDVGMGRTGVQTPQAALALAQHVDRAAGIRFDGLMCFPGHIWGQPDSQAPQMEEISAKLDETLYRCQEHGLEASIVSGGSTPTALQSHLVPELTEIRPGTFVYYDWNCVTGGYCRIEDCAARIVATVVSDAVPNQVVIDAGSKTLTSDRCPWDPDSGHGHLVEYPDAKIAKLHEEHGQVDVSGCRQRPSIGERVTVIPNHICPCVNLQDHFWWHDDGQLERLPVEARGKLS